MKTVRITTIITMDNLMFADWCKTNKNLPKKAVDQLIDTKKLTLSRTPTSITHYELIDHDKADDTLRNDRS